MVKECSRKGCESIMCDKYNSTVGYICDECFDEFEDKSPPVEEKGKLVESLIDFMLTEKASTDKELVHQETYFTNIMTEQENLFYTNMITEQEELVSIHHDIYNIIRGKNTIDESVQQVAEFLRDYEFKENIPKIGVLKTLLVLSKQHRNFDIVKEHRNPLEIEYMKLLVDN